MLFKNSETSSDLSLQAHTTAARGLRIWNSKRKPRKCYAIHHKHIVVQQV